MSLWKRLLSVTIAILCFASGFLTNKIIGSATKNSFPTFTETRNQGSYKYINPLLECEGADFQFNPNFNNIKKSLDNYIDKNISQKNITYASIYYRDMNNGPWFGINENELFSPASLIKVPLLIAYYKLADTNPLILQKNISIGSTYNSSNQSILPQTTLDPTKQYTVDQLIQQMIIYSDNHAYDILLSNIDGEILIKTYSDLGVDVSKGLLDPTGNILSVKSYASFFRILYNSSYLSKDMSEKALHLLSQIQYHEGLTLGVPKNIIVAHKYGERSYEATGEKQLHDCGIVYFPKKPYLICVMTRGRDFQKLSSTIKDISQLVFNNLYQQTNRN